MSNFAVIKNNQAINVSSFYGTYKVTEQTAQSTRDVAWAAINPGDPAGSGQAAWDSYTGSLQTAFNTMQVALGASINVVQEFFQGAFDDFQTILSGGGLMSDVTAAGDKLTTAMNSSLDDGGKVANEILAGSEETALIMNVTLGKGTTGTDTFGFDDNPATYADEVVLQIEDRSFANATIPFAIKTVGEEGVPSVAAIGTRKGPARDYAGGTRAKVDLAAAKKIPLLVGELTRDSHQLESDGYTFTIQDDRYLLSGVHIVGTFHFDPANPKNLFYKHRGKAIFNENGKANCLDSPLGPVFAPFPDFGIEQGTDVRTSITSDDSGNIQATSGTNEEDEESQSVARYWRIDDIINYLRTTLFERDSVGASLTKFPMYNFLSASKVVWPGGLGSSLLVDGVITSDDAAAIAGIRDGDREGGTKAKIVHLDLTSMDLETAFKKIAESAGAYGIYMKALKDGKSQITFRPTRYRRMHNRDGNQKHIIRQSVTKPAKNKPTVMHGSIDRDFENAFGSVWVLGDIVFCDVKIVFDPTTGGVFSEDEVEWDKQNFRPAFTPGMMNMFREYIADDDNNLPTGVAKSSQAFHDATNILPFVFNAFRINKDTADAVDPDVGNFLKNTKYEGWPDLLAPPPILDHLVTWSVEQGKGSLRRILPLQIPVEIRKFTGVVSGGDDDGKATFGDWITIGKLDGLEIDDQGTLYLPGLREAALSGLDKGTWVGKVGDPKGDPTAVNRLTARPIRMTVAVAYDHRLNTCQSLPSASRNLHGGDDSLDLLQVSDPNGENFSFDREFSRQYVADTGDSYREYLRLADPIPDTVLLTKLESKAETTDDNGEVVPAISTDPHQLLLGKQIGPRTGVDGIKEVLSDLPFARIHAQRRLAAVGRPWRTGNLQFPHFVVWEPGVVIDRLKTTGGVNSGVHRIEAILSKIRLGYQDQVTEMDLR